MNTAFDRLKDLGWLVTTGPIRQTLPQDVLDRYDRIPSDLLAAIVSTEVAVSPDEKAWFLCHGDYAGASDAAFRWNEWEQQSLEAASGDSDWESQIRGFWDAHFPFLLSVKSGYAYYAIRMIDGAVVAAEEPEFEEVTQVAANFADFMSKLQQSPGLFSRHI